MFLIRTIGVPWGIPFSRLDVEVAGLSLGSFVELVPFFVKHSIYIRSK